MWQLSSMRLRIYSLFQKYRARSATWGSEIVNTSVTSLQVPVLESDPATNPGHAVLLTPHLQGSSDQCGEVQRTLDLESSAQR